VHFLDLSPLEDDLLAKLGLGDPAMDQLSRSERSRLLLQLAAFCALFIVGGVLLSQAPDAPCMNSACGDWHAPDMVYAGRS
jgi:hypothetical protein